MITIPAIQPGILELVSSENDRAFLTRVYSTNADVYAARLRAIGFAGCGRVLDAGCGFGQWSFVLGSLNDSVMALDISTDRIKVCSALAETVGQIAVPSFGIGSLEEIPIATGSVDAVFCYSAVYQTDYRRTFREFHRVLKPNGKLYINTNDLGWYLYNLLNDHNPASDYSSRALAIGAIQNTIDFLDSGNRLANVPLIMPVDTTVTALERTGFRLIAKGGDGTVNVTGTDGSRAFYASEYHGHPSVYEVLCYKV